MTELVTNPYAPPTTAAPRPELREWAWAFRLARVQCAAVIVASALVGVTALLLRATLVKANTAVNPRSYVANVEIYSRLLRAHATFAAVATLPTLFGAVAALLVPDALSAKRLPTIGLHAAAVFAWIGGGALLAVLCIDDFFALGPRQQLLPKWGVVAFDLLALSLLLNLAHVLVVVARDVRRAPLSGRVTALALTLGLLWQVLQFAPVLTAHAASLLELAPRVFTSRDALVVPTVLCALAVSVHVLSPKRKAGVAPKLFVIAGVAPTVILVGLTQIVLRSDSPAHAFLEDTLVSTGSLHASASLIFLAYVAMAHTWFERAVHRSYLEWPARIGAAVTSLGIVGLNGSMIALGSRGMPRQYVTYLPQFERYQTAITLAAYVTAIGFGATLVAFVGGRKLPPPAAAAPGSG